MLYTEYFSNMAALRDSGHFVGPLFSLDGSTVTAFDLPLLEMDSVNVSYGLSNSITMQFEPEITSFWVQEDTALNF